MIFLLGIGILIICLAGFSAWLSVKRSQESQFGIPVVSDKKVESKPDPVKVIVTYNDGITETFEKDGEIEYCDGAGLIIRLEGRCITISPFAYRKVEEIHTGS